MIAVEAWQSITREDTQHLVMSMDHRFQEVIAFKGYTTNQIYQSTEITAQRNPTSVECVNWISADRPTWRVRCPMITPDKTLQCEVCGEAGLSVDLLETHPCLHTGERPFSYSECGEGFASSEALLQHQCVPSRGSPFPCSDCGNSFQTYKDLEERCDTPGESPFTYRVCGKGLTQSSSLLQNQNIHSGERAFKCSLCGKRFSRSSHLLRHQRIHTEAKPFYCSKCGKGFVNSFSLQEYTHQVCSDSVCGVGFTQTLYFRSHQRVHSGKKPFTCSLGGKRFYRSSTLQVHQWFHIREKSITCSLCRKWFS
ncbi:zinc finger protein 235-like [Narcine bancroftii]|uniref:zinc finger protein 235-like n=1 Tax=Narcine bancroftii TaxID=1343680 RepID=UPI003831218F